MAEGRCLEVAIPNREQRHVEDGELVEVLDYIFDLKKPSKPDVVIKKVR